jgi:PIN domain nuclease of toxin-antitoxin system
MNEALLDTHIALWLDSGDRRLRRSTRTLIDDVWRNGGTILISAVTAWEIVQLVHAGRLILDLPPEDWIERFTNKPGVKIIPLTHHAAIGSYRLHDLEHRDPADRLLIATAIERGCPLITHDAHIVRFGQTHGGEYGFTTGT